MARFRLTNPLVKADPSVQQNFEGIQTFLNKLAPTVPVVTSLPTSPADGTVIDYVADSTNGVVWRFRYRSASASSYKWEALGPSPIGEALTGSTTRAVSTYGDVAAGAMTTWTLPFAGDYRIEIGANMAPGSAGHGMLASFSVAGATALDTDAALAYFGAGTAPGQSSFHNVALKTGLAAGTTIQPKFKAQGASAGTVDKRYIWITPRRVG